MIVVSSVSCIYGLGEPDDFEKMMVSLRVGDCMGRARRPSSMPWASLAMAWGWSPEGVYSDTT